jgi:hypothetical protein
MTSATLTLNEELGIIQRAHGRRAILLAIVRMAWVVPVALLLALYIDVVFPMSSDWRVGADALIAAIACSAAWTGFRVATRSRSRTRMVARMVEQGHPEARNDLVNAIDFEEELSVDRPRNVSTTLMQAEIAEAAETVRKLPGFSALRPKSLRKEAMFMVGAVAAAALLPAVFPHVFSAVLPRFLDPYGDHPPYSATRFAVMPAGESINYGEDLKVDVETSGRLVDEVTLVVEDPEGREVAELPMFRSDDRSFFQTIEAPRTDLQYFARIDGGRSKRYPLTINQIPRIEYASVSFIYPAYTGLSPKTRLVGDAPIRTYEGTEVTLTLTSNRPLDAGALSVDGTEVAMAPRSEANTVSGSFVLSSAGNLTASVIDVDGRQSVDTVSVALEILPDEEPNVTVASPGRHSLATPDVKIPIVIEASDDLGVARIELFRNHNQSDDNRERLFTAEAVQTLADGVMMLDLEALGVEPGDTLEYYATATDSKPGAPQTEASEAFQLRIISQDEYREFMQTEMTAEDLNQKYGDMLDDIEKLAAKQEAIEQATNALHDKMASGEALSEQEETELADLLGQQRDLADQADQLAKELTEESKEPSVFDVEDEYKKSLSEIAKQLAKAGKHMEQSEQDMKSANEQSKGRQSAMASASEAQRKALEELGRQMETFQEEIQQANQDLENVYHLMEDVEMFKHLYKLQQRIERQARTYKDAADPSIDEQIRLKELGEQQAAVEDALEELKDRLREHAEEIQVDYPVVAQDAVDIADQIEQREIPSIMDRATAQLAKADALEGHPTTLEAKNEMEAMIQFCQATAGNGSSQCELRLQIKMSMNPGNTMGQFGKSLSAGAGQNFGGFGMGQAGQGGMSAGSSPFNVYGSEESMGNPKADKESSRGKRRMADTKPGPDDPDPLAGDIEELPMPEAADLALENGRGEHVMEEYRPLIEAYFRSMADESR